MVVYEVCSCYVKFSQNQPLSFEDYQLGMVYNSSAPADVEAEYVSQEEAETDFRNRRSTVICKNGKLVITEFFLSKSEFERLDEDGYPEQPIHTTLMGIAPLADEELADKLIELWRDNGDFV